MLGPVGPLFYQALESSSDLQSRKLKRPIVEKAFAKQVEQMYASKETYVRYQE